MNNGRRDITVTDSIRALLQVDSCIFAASEVAGAAPAPARAPIIALCTSSSINSLLVCVTYQLGLPYYMYFEVEIVDGIYYW